jgi:glutaredoxin-like protein NrdH
VQVVLYALSTCGWCRRAKKMLEEHDVEYELVYVDQLEGDEKDAAVSVVAKWNPRKSFPTLVVDDRVGVAGFKPEQIKEALEL